MTPEGVARLTAKLERLKRSLPAAIAEVSRTSAYGDRSENAEYKEAKTILRRMKGDILRIEDELKRIVVISKGRDASGKVRLGSTVTIQANGAQKKYRILGPAETDPMHGAISHTSPLGAALIGHAEGDTVTVVTPNGPKTYSILKVE